MIIALHCGDLDSMRPECEWTECSGKKIPRSVRLGYNTYNADKSCVGKSPLKPCLINALNSPTKTLTEECKKNFDHVYQFTDVNDYLWQDLNTEYDESGNAIKQDFTAEKPTETIKQDKTIQYIVLGTVFVFLIVIFAVFVIFSYSKRNINDKKSTYYSYKTY